MINRRETTPEKALERLEALCAKSERCTADARRKLFQWGIQPDTADRIIESLHARCFIDDERFAHAYVRDKWIFNHWGRRKILSGLSSLHISSAIAHTAISEEINEEEYYAGICRIATRKISRLDTILDYNQANRILRSLVAAGYEPALAARAIRECSSRLNDNKDE